MLTSLLNLKLRSDMARHIQVFLVIILYMVLCSSHSIPDFHLTILHTGDITGSFQQFNSVGDTCSTEDDRLGDCVGGVARQATVIKDVRNERIGQEDANFLLLDSGDLFSGKWFDVYKGKATSHFMNELQYDAMVSLGVALQSVPLVYLAVSVAYRLQSN